MKKFIKDFLFLILYYSNRILRKRKKIPPKNPNKILVISWYLIGDTFLSLSTIASLKQCFNKSNITVVCKPIVKDLFKYMDEVDNIIVLEDDFLNTRYELKKLSDNYDLTIDLTNNLPSAFFSLFSNAKYKIGGSGIYKVLGKKFIGFPFIYNKILPPPGNEYVIEYLNKIVLNAFPDFKIDKHWRFDVPQIQIPIEEKSPKQIFVGLGLGASRNENLWESEKWISLVNKLTLNENITIFLMGSNSETELSKAIVGKTNKQTISFVGKTTLIEAIQKVKLMDYFISNDSGLMHVSIHYDVPTICMSGPSNYLNYIPQNNAFIKTVRKEVFCQPCYNFLHIAEKAIHHDCNYNTSLCKKLIKVNDVLVALEKIKIITN
jgi:heptosyltransferase-2